MLGLDLIRHTRKTGGGLVELTAEIHTEIYNEPLFGNHQYFSEDAFRQRYEMALEQPSFELIMARHRGKEIGYIYGHALLPEIGWWNSIEWSEQMESNRLDDYTSEDGTRTAVIPEMLVRMPWRRMGVACALHDLFMSGRREQRAGLRVLPNNLPAKTAYLKWGWNTVGMAQSMPNVPLFECMVKSLR
jgi:hypothetical protein